MAMTYLMRLTKKKHQGYILWGRVTFSGCLDKPRGLDNGLKNVQHAVQLSGNDI